jgi:hypothetical protein
MTQPTEPRIRHLRAYLERGIAPGAEVADVRRELGISDTAADGDVARSLVQILSAAEIASLGPCRDAHVSAAPASSRTRSSATPTHGGDASFLGRLSVSGASGLGVDDLDDPATLACVLRAGSLRQRRAAARRLAVLHAERKGLPDDLVRRIAELRDPALDHELRPLRGDARDDRRGSGTRG